MSSASATRTIKFISKAGVYTAVIMCPDGDLYQDWEGTADDVTGVYPDFARTQPVLFFICTSSRVAEGVVTPDGIGFYFNGMKIDFSGDTSTGTFAGLFRKVSPAGDNPYYGLRIVGNIAAASGYASATIRMEARISYGTQQDTIQASYAIPVQPATGSSCHVTIAAGDTKNFVITGKGGSCILKAMAYLSGNPLTKDLTYEWEKMGPSGWSVIAGQTAQTLTVHGDDIDTYGEYRVTVRRHAEYLGQDIQGVMDASDPYDIDPHPVPEDETITEDPDDNDRRQVTYTPVVVSRGSGVKAFDTRFYFAVKDASGNILNADTGTPKASCTVTRAQCVQAGGDVSVTITSEN